MWIGFVLLGVVAILATGSNFLLSIELRELREQKRLANEILDRINEPR